MLRLQSRGSRNRTHIDGFGDRCSTFELCPYFDRFLNHRRLLYPKECYLVKINIFQRCGNASVTLSVYNERKSQVRLMEIIDLNKKILPKWAGVVPEELFVELMMERDNRFACGVTFMDQVAGAVCWEENGAIWKLQSIYIFPEFRRLGLGSELIHELEKRLWNKKGKKLTVTYGDEDELVMVSPFLTYCGFEMEEVDIPEGITTLEGILEGLKSNGILDKTGKCTRLYQLTAKDRNVCRALILKELGENMDNYLFRKPASYAVMDQNEVIGLLLFREEGDHLVLDYCKIKRASAARMLPLFAAAANDLSSKYPPDTKVSMILSNEAAVNLYSRLVGNTYQDATLINGCFEVLPVEWI